MENRIKLFVKVLAATFVAACGGPKTSLENKATFPARTQCKSTGPAAFKAIVGGEETMEYASVVLLMNSENDSVSRCTATFIADNLLITAAHCVPKNLDGKIRVLIDDCPNNQTIDIKSEKLWHLGVAGEDFDNPDDLTSLAVSDLAIVKVASNPTGVKTNLPSKPLMGGETALAIGYGMEAPSLTATGLSGYVDSKKKVGKIVAQADAAAKPLFSHLSDRSQPALASGDSGGPLLRSDEIVGIASLGWSEYVDEYLSSTWVNMFSPKAFELLTTVQSEIGGLANWDQYKSAYEGSQ